MLLQSFERLRQAFARFCQRYLMEQPISRMQGTSLSISGEDMVCLTASVGPQRRMLRTLVVDYYHDEMTAWLRLNGFDYPTTLRSAIDEAFRTMEREGHDAPLELGVTAYETRVPKREYDLELCFTTVGCNHWFVYHKVNLACKPGGAPLAA